MFGALLSAAGLALLLAVGLHKILEVQYTVHGSGVVVVTGASTGIGRHFVETFAREHSEFLVLAGVRKEADAESIRSVGLSNLRPWTVDVTDKASCAEAAESLNLLLAKEKKSLVALVNNAGTARNFPIEFHNLDDARSLFETNFFGMIKITQLLLPQLRASKGRVIQISSVAGKISTPRSGMYSSTKFAMEAVSDALRRELVPFGVSVSIVEPAYVKSQIFGKAIQATQEAVETGDARETYSHLYTEKKMAAKRKELAAADEPTVTTKAIQDAILSPTPKTRYVVANVGGVPAFVLTTLAWLLPDRAVDLLTA